MALVAELGDEIVAVARYDRPPDADMAEVAFTVQDDQQGRGLATIMLEHLAAVARTHGIHRFTAETLPDNRKMLGVFRDAGFQVVREFADGVVHVTFPIDPTDASQAMQDEREQISEARSVRRLLAPRSIAVIGAGRQAGTIGHEVFRNLLAGEFTGAVYPVNPNATAVGEHPRLSHGARHPRRRRPRGHHRSGRVGRRRGAPVGGQGRARPRRHQRRASPNVVVPRSRRSSSSSPGCTGCAWSGPTAWAS